MSSFNIKVEGKFVSENFAAEFTVFFVTLQIFTQFFNVDVEMLSLIEICFKPFSLNIFRVILECVSLHVLT